MCLSGLHESKVFYPVVYEEKRYLVPTHRAFYYAFPVGPGNYWNHNRDAFPKWLHLMKQDCDCKHSWKRRVPLQVFPFLMTYVQGFTTTQAEGSVIA